MAETNDQAPQVPTLEQLAEIVKQQQVVIGELQASNLSLQSNALKVADKPVKLEIPKEPVTYKGKKYAFQLAKFTLPGHTAQTFTAAEAATDEDVIKQILAIEGQGVLKQLV